MKKNIHPINYNVCFTDISSGKHFLTQSTKKSKTIIEINNIKFYQFIIDISSDTHPIYTGKKRFVDTAGRIQNFNNKFKRKRFTS